MTAAPATLSGQGIGTWNAYMAYHDIQQIRKAGNYLFVLASNGLYQYNLNDGSIATYDKVSGLSDACITNIAWNSRAGRLIAVYDNSNIDLVETNGDVTNISDLYSKSMTEDKTVNTIRMDAQYAYLATNFGVVKVDMARAEISETYNLGIAVARLALDDGRIYARTASGEVWAADLTANLIDRNNWGRVDSWRPGIFDLDTSDYDEYHGLVSTLNPGGPDYNYMGFLMFKGGRLYTANGMTNLEDKACVQVLEDGEWTVFENDIEDRIGMGRSLEGMDGLMFDSRGLMWFGNNHYRQPGLLRYNTAQSELTAYDRDFANQDGTNLTLTYLRDVTEDRDGNIWFATSAGPMYVTPQQIASGDATMAFNQFKVPRNDGTNYADYLLGNISISAIAIDGANRKWFGTSDNGIYLISADNMTQLLHFTTENSPLLSNNVMDIAIDGQTGEVFIGTDRGLCSYMGDATDPAEEMEKDNVYAYPNPVEPGYTGLITVTGLSFDADVKVTTASGALVASGRSNGGTFTWDGRDSRGRRVASGVYSVVTAKSDGSKGTVCKIAIIN